MASWRSNPTLVRAWHLVTVVIITASVITTLVYTLRGLNSDVQPPEHREPFSTGGAVLNFFSYFTIQSNILLALGAATLVVNPQRDGTGWRVLRLSGLLGITVTGIVYVTVLRGLAELEGVRALTNIGMHYLAPLLGAVGWLLFGPWPRVSWRVIGLSLVWPVAWLAYTLVRGELVDWYPYPFLDVIDHGYGRVALNSLVVTAIFVALAWAYLALDRRFSRTRESVVT